DLLGVHVVAAAHVHLLAATGQVEPALVVDPAQVAGAHRTVASEGGVGRVRVLPVPGHHSTRSETDMADLAVGHRLVVFADHRQHDARLGPADRHLGVLWRIVEARAAPDGRLRARVANGQRYPEPGAGVADQRGRRRPAADD